MAVLLADRELTITRFDHKFGRDEMGTPVRDTGWTTAGPFPGAAREQPDGTWRLRIDSAAWMLRADDEISDGTHTWVVVSATLVSVPGHPDVDHIAITATLNPPDVP